ncbi:unannotated protein [freshwater metagenome]|uniref:Unannotated protein n=1 Tax=freshwater metagenome TaxID=449393 RepID=A0A6J6GIL5_9ZZZZ|nr:hypothetical protein [Actinomycetota bacterium]MSY07714.1 hypothetical protein [Actinomycetota bacterium]MSZ37454.1 hypothetical protein [Actinomycetota bacterium]MSZ99741.1 hypothetical protein [Actinomycetota bacterium]MTA09707.1 hypothetical protein [Actinomycetota bacterium]
MNQTANPSGDPASLSLPDLRAERDTLRQQEDAVSFVRRLAQGRLDLVTAVKRHRADGSGAVSVAEIVRSGVGPAPSTGSARPPRDTEVSADHPLLAEFDALCDSLGFDNMADLDDLGLTSLENGIQVFESAQSDLRRQLFDRIDALTAELVRRYRDGDASVDTLLQN